jgi:hypothetical protein
LVLLDIDNEGALIGPDGKLRSCTILNKSAVSEV